MSDALGLLCTSETAVVGVRMVCVNALRTTNLLNLLCGYEKRLDIPDFLAKIFLIR